MFRIYYNEQGEIINFATTKYATDKGNYIDVEEQINVNEYTIDVDTKQLIAKTS